MDPTTALKNALAALSALNYWQGCAEAEEHRQDAIEALEALADWLAKGGFAPRVGEAVESYDAPV